MNTIKKAKAPPAASAAVSFQQIVQLALAVAKDKLQSLLSLYEQDDDLGEGVCEIDYALRVGMERIDRMYGCEYKDYSDFDAQWFGVASILKMSWQLLAQKDTHYGRLLSGACEFFSAMRNTVEFVGCREKNAAKASALTVAHA